MKEFTQIENYAVEIWRRPYQRSMKLTVRADGRLRVTCGRRIPQREIARFIDQSRAFIAKQDLRFAALRSRFPAKKYLRGDEFLFFGSRVALEVIWTWTSRVRVSVDPSGVLEILAPIDSSLADRQKALQHFFRKQARLHLTERVAHWSAQMELVPRQLSIRGQRTRWGSCSARHVVNLNWKLLCAPVAVIDYVVIHELAHIRHLNHAPGFWDLVARYQPDWKQSRRWLKEHEFEISVQFGG